MSRRLASKIAVITGTSSGLGRAIALAFAREGATVTCSDINPNSINFKSGEPDTATHNKIIEQGGKSIFVKCDTSRSEDVQNLIKKTVEESGRVDIMVNNAGVSLETKDPRPIWEYAEGIFDKTIAINLRGVFLGCKYASAQMIKQDPHPNGDRGWIINLASIVGLIGMPKYSGYVASKHGVLGLKKSAAWECAEHRIHVNAICPGYKSRPCFRLEAMHPFRGLGEPEDIARAAVFLASEDASWVTGVGLPVDGGYSQM
ncbi:putative short chain type dehydrogenase [Delitschia confertaspora ATCC 74209]|uniref:Short chain type dehydrogenase n=1 Tax=Delitschia confertaspora ATCC 74209 TaxID=1513339 RepID=A0A9P4JRJ7_9PLEO|nr:putative short chain type dehydrogenase [Delitschia confertaspora ATCC 74209]